MFVVCVGLIQIDFVEIGVDFSICCFCQCVCYSEVIMGEIVYVLFVGEFYIVMGDVMFYVICSLLFDEGFFMFYCGFG